MQNPAPSGAGFSDVTDTGDLLTFPLDRRCADAPRPQAKNVHGSSLPCTFSICVCRGSGVVAVCRVVDVQQLVGAALEQIVVDIAQIGVLLRDAQGAGFVGLEDGLGALGLALVAGGGRNTLP